MKSRKILAGLLALAFVFGGTALPTAVSSFDTAVTASAEEFGDFSYSRYYDNVLINSYNGSDAEVTVPAEIDGKTVIGIKSGAFAENESVTSVTLPEGLEFIGEYAFGDCINLKSIDLPDSLTSIS